MQDFLKILLGRAYLAWLVCQRFFIYKMGVISVLLDRDLCGCVLKKRVHVKLVTFNYEREVDT